MQRKRGEFDEFTNEKCDSEVAELNYWWYTQGEFDMELANELNHATVGWWSNSWHGWDEVKLKEKDDSWFDN